MTYIFSSTSRAVLLSHACDLARFGVFLTNTLPVYVRHDEDKPEWLGHVRSLSTGEYTIIRATTLVNLEKSLKEYIQHEEA